MATSPIDFAGMMPQVATHLLGEPSQTSGGELRYGTHGSLSVNLEDGTFYSHEEKAGGGVIDLIIREMGGDRIGALKWLEENGYKEPFEKQDNVWQIGKRKRSPGRTFYDYCDADGAVAYRVERIESADGKTFRQHGPDGSGGFRCAAGCMKGVEPLPYRLPDWINADPSKAIFVVEGEKDVDALASLGLFATTNSGGSCKFAPSLAPYFAGRKVVVIPDNDKAGRDHAAVVCEILKPVAAVLTVMLLPGLAEKEDVSDWLAKGNTVEQLKDRARAALAEPMTVGGDADAGLETPLLPTIDPASWLGVDVPDQQWALTDYIPWHQATYFTGPGSVGKSLLTQILCTCIAAGIPFLGVETRQSVAMYITCEDDHDVLHRRQKAICDSLGVRLADLSGKLHLVSLMGELGNELCTFDDHDRLVPSPRFKQTVATMEAAGVQFIALDNVAHLFPEEIARNKVAAQVNLLNRLARDLDAAVLFLGHPNKEGAEYSGSTAWENQVRSRMFMGWEEGEAANPDGRVLKRSKSNYSPKGGDIGFIWHKGSFVRLDDLPPSLSAEIGQISQANAENAAFLRCLEACTKAQRAVSHNPGSNYAPKIFADMTEGAGFKAGAFKRAMERLIHIDQIRLDQPLWRGPNRVMKQGIRAALDCTNPPQEMAENRAPTPAPTPCTNPHETRRNPARFNPPYTTYKTGAAPGAAAPSPDHELSRPVLTREPVDFPDGDDDDLDADGNTVGWNDDRRPRF